MYLYVLIFKGEPILKIGYCSSFARVKGLQRDFPLDLAHSYYISSEDKGFLKRLEYHLLWKFRYHEIGEAYKVKYRLGISFLSPSGSTELRSIDCLQDVIQEIKVQLGKSETECTDILNGIPLKSPSKDTGTLLKKVSNEQVWFDSLFDNILNMMLWLRDPPNNPVQKTEGVFLIAKYKKVFLLVCDGADCLKVRSMLQVWVHPTCLMDLVEEVRDLGGGIFVLVGSLNRVPTKNYLRQLFPSDWWFKRFYSLLQLKFFWAFDAATGHSSRGAYLPWLNKKDKVEGLNDLHLETVKSMAKHMESKVTRVENTLP